MTDGSRRWALVTGASSGIGLAFAQLLAAQGYNVVLTARRGDRLDALARDLSQRHQIRTFVVPVDLADSGGVDQLLHAIAQEAIAVDFLVNNAGFGVPGRYAGTTWAQQRDFLQVMVTAVAELTHRLLPGMLEREWGRIVNIASLAGLLPAVAGHTLYAASKSFLISFSESLAHEARPHGVHVTATCPGFTLTEFHDVTGTRGQVSQLPAFMWLDAEHVAKSSYDAVMAGVPIYVPGRLNRMMASLARLLPRGLVVSVMRRTGGKFRKT